VVQCLPHRLSCSEGLGKRLIIVTSNEHYDNLNAGGSNPTDMVLLNINLLQAVD
jgi:hypothetical protein